jgi:hypothetical protein
MLKTEDKTWDSFRGGRYTRNNLVKISDDHLLVANQLYFPGDGIAHKRPGYTLVQAGIGFNATRIFDFQRQSDFKQFIILTGGGFIAWMPVGGGKITVLSEGEDPEARWFFATNVFGLYGSNGIKNYRFVDTGNGLLTKFNWGIQAPTAIPTFSFAAGTLTLTQGRQYAYSFVSKWTDASGTQRVHVGPPCGLTGSTGPQTLETVILGDLQTSADPQVTHLWIWATNDTPLNTTSALFFLAEVTNGTASYGDQLPDSSLDTTRLIPYENFPPPAGGILSEYQQRIIIAGIAGKADLVQMTGLEEVALGIPQETAPSDTFFNVPGGTKAVSGHVPFNSLLMVSTEVFWWPISGSSAETFSEGDIIFSPGMVGPDAYCVTSMWLAWLGRDKKLWAWNGSGDPIEVSWKIARSDGSEQLSMESLSEAQLATAQMRWFSFEQHNLVMVLVSTQQNEYFDWCQIWDVSILSGPQSQLGGVLTKDGLLLGAAEGDTFFSDQIVGSGNVLSGDIPYIYLADNQQNIYRWPDGFNDNGKQYFPVAGSEFTDHDAPGFKKRYRWMDAITSRISAVTDFNAGAVASDGISLDKKPVGVPIQPVPGPGPVDPTCFRAKLEIAGAALGRYMRWFIGFPADDNDCELYKVEVKASIVGKDTR